MTILKWPEWLPDQPAFQSAGSPLIRNCLPLTQQSYGPMPTALLYSTNALSERCQGAYAIKASDNTVHMFAGDRTKLYLMPPGSKAFTDVSRGSGGAYATTSPASGGHWSMTSYGARVIATNGVDAPQTLVIPTGASPQFAALAAGAPVARYVATVLDFLMFGWTTDGVSGPQPTRIWWSGINSPQSWPTPGSPTALQQESDYQDLQQTDLGQVTGLVSGFSPSSSVSIWMERGIYSGSYVGPPLIFNFRVAQGAAGTRAPMSIVQAFARDNAGAVRPVVYYLGSDGFAAFDGTTSFPIGSQKFDRTFYARVDDAFVHLVQGVSDPRTRTVLWAYPTPGSNGVFTHLLVYNWEIGRASLSELEASETQAEWITSAMYATSYDIDHIDQFGDLDTVQPPFDDPWWSGNAADRLSLFDRSHRLNIMGGPAMAASLDTAEIQPAEGRRAWVQLTRPLIDGGVEATITVGHRERQSDPVTWEAPVPINELGECPQRCTGRYLRFRLQLPRGSQFTQLQGLDVQIKPEGRLR